jgi:hypothetical protein
MSERRFHELSQQERRDSTRKMVEENLRKRLEETREESREPVIHDPAEPITGRDMLRALKTALTRIRTDISGLRDTSEGE